MTRSDFYRLAIESLIPPDTPDYWAEYRTGASTHFDALRRYFAAIPGTEAEVLEVVRRMELDPQLPAVVASLRSAGWQVLIASAGCDWYIRRLLSAARVDLTVYANPGRFEAGRGVIMERPLTSPYQSHELGIDKAAVVRHHLSAGATVAFAGDGFPDFEAALLVDAELRFARGDLAQELRKAGFGFHSYCQWSDIAIELTRLVD